MANYKDTRKDWKDYEDDLDGILGAWSNTIIKTNKHHHSTKITKEDKKHD